MIVLAQDHGHPVVDLRHDKDGLWLGDTRVRTLSVKTFPPAVSFGQVGHLIGDLFSGHRGLKYPFLLTTNLFFPDQQKTRTGLGAKRQWTTNMPADTAAIERHRAEGLNVAEAINAVLEHRRAMHAGEAA